MAFSFMTAAEFNRFPSAAKRKAAEGPLVITEHGRKGYVLMSYEAFETLESETNRRRTLLDLADPESADIEFEIERDASFGRDVDFE